MCDCMCDFCCLVSEQWNCAWSLLSGFSPSAGRHADVEESLRSICNLYDAFDLDANVIRGRTEIK